jgi:hypothetical protein
MKTDDMIRNGMHAAILIALVFVLLFLLTFTGVMKCSQLPLAGAAWCDVYWGVKTFVTGSPRVLIVYGDSGLGNPTGFGNGSLEELLAEPTVLGVYSDTVHIGRVNFGNLRNYDLVIVERARQIETKQLRAFIDYAMLPTGGTLVWTGDAGTELGPNDHYLYTSDKDPDDDTNSIIGPWARRDGDEMISFDELLGVRTVDMEKIRFCELASCLKGQAIYGGNLETEPSGNHPLIRGISASLPLYFFEDEDFAVVETLSGSVTTEVLSLDLGSELSASGSELERSLPLIVTSGIGERVVYYAMPPEYYANPKLATAGKEPYLLPVENLYYGTLKG